MTDKKKKAIQLFPEETGQVKVVLLFLAISLSIFVGILSTLWIESI